jgi:hypothetical protein
LNCRPLPYQGSALPLSYGSMPGVQSNKESAPEGPREARRCVPQGLHWRKVGRAPGQLQTGVKLARQIRCAGRGSGSRIMRKGPSRLVRAGRGLRERRARHNMFDASAPQGAIFRTARPKFAMTDESPNNRRQHTLRGDEARQDRLKAKLRENLKRRKSQERERDRLSSDGHQDCPDGEVGNTDG